MRVVLLLLVGLAAWATAPARPAAGITEPVSVTGAQRLLVVPVRFSGVPSRQTLAHFRDKADKVGRYIKLASYGKAWLESTVADWVDMPEPLRDYTVSPHNYGVDKNRVAHLVGDALGAVRRAHDLGSYAAVWILVGVPTRPGTGYGMIAYACNPGMLSNFRQTGPRLETVALRGGGTFAGPCVVSAENAHVGHVAHDLLHALGGARDGRRAVPDLYDFPLQSNPPGEMTPKAFAIHVGPWDIMSQHFVDRFAPPPMPSSFTRRQLGWLAPDAVATVGPGETREVALAPLSSGAGILAARVPLSDTRYLMVENRQPVGADKVLPAAGLVVLEVDTAGNEGAMDGRPIVRAADANPSTSSLDDAPFVPGGGEKRFYEDRDAGVVVEPLALAADKTLRVLIRRR